MKYIEVNGKFFLQFVKALGLVRHTNRYDITMFLNPDSEVDEPEGFMRWIPKISFYIRKDLMEEIYDLSRNYGSAPEGKPEKTGEEG